MPKSTDKSQQSAGGASGGKGEQSMLKEVLSWVEVIVIAVALAFFIDNVIIINATVPSGSMEKTIMTHSRVLGTRFAYWKSSPKRGDIVVFRYPIDDALGKNTHYIKRIIGLPGEKVEIKEGAVYIDGKKLEESYINGTWTVENDGFTFEVPEGEYLMLGDNRNNSNDARYWPSLAIREGLAAIPTMPATGLRSQSVKGLPPMRRKPCSMPLSRRRKSSARLISATGHSVISVLCIPKTAEKNEASIPQKAS